MEICSCQWTQQIYLWRLFFSQTWTVLGVPPCVELKKGSYFWSWCWRKGHEVIKTLDVLIIFHDNTPVCLKKLSLCPKADGVSKVRGANCTGILKTKNFINIKPPLFAYWSQQYCFLLWWCLSLGKKCLRGNFFTGQSKQDMIPGVRTATHKCFFFL